ncbi:MAG: hypothetical protein JWP01_1321 [Myxococcales bacterium]|nr:hypothetical protein [Myxococcales bacterium]
MNRFASLSLVSLMSAPLLVACTGGERATSGECPAGELCSPDTPRGLHFVGNAMADQVFGSAFGPAATAVGGTQEIALEWDRGDGVLVAFTLPYAADDDGAIGIAVDSSQGSVVTVRGAGSRKNYLRIVEPTADELYDRYELAGAAITSMRVIGTELETLPPGNPTIVFATGDQELAIALFGEVQNGSSPRSERLIDSSMELAMAASQRVAWDTLRMPNATVGNYALQVTAGDKPTATLDVEVVSGADTMILIGSSQPTVAADGSTSVCFAAMNGQRYVYGLTWTFVVDGRTETHGKSALNRNCVVVSADGLTSGSIPVMASAGGRTASTTVAVGQMARSIEPVAPATPGRLLRSETTAGDRAAM